MKSLRVIPHSYGDIVTQRQMPSQGDIEHVTVSHLILFLKFFSSLVVEKQVLIQLSITKEHSKTQDKVVESPFKQFSKIRSNCSVPNMCSGILRALEVDTFCLITKWHSQFSLRCWLCEENFHLPNEPTILLNFTLRFAGGWSFNSDPWYMQ